MKNIETNSLLFLNNLSVLRQTDALKQEIDALRPISKAQEEIIMQKFRLDWNYNSNAIEGNSLDYGETAAFLMHGVTAKGKPLKDYLDIKGHNETIDYLMYLVHNAEELSEKDIRSMHEMLLVEPYESTSQTIEGVSVQKRIKLGEYKRTPNHVRTITGEIHHYATPEDTPILMGELMDWYRKNITDNILHPIVIASIFHHRFTSIHPFDDGNGRMSRLLMNLILMRYAYPPVVIKNSNKNEYYLTLSQADTGDVEPFIKFIADNAMNSLNIYLKGARGESIEDQSDLKKKLALFKKEVEARRDKVEVKKSPVALSDVYNTCIRPFSQSLNIVLSEFKDLFFGFAERKVEYVRNPTDRWQYQEINVSNYLEQLFSSGQDIDTEVIALQFLDFKLAEASFSVEVKVSMVFRELDYDISYSFSEVNELVRAKSLLYSQWMGRVALKSYYHHVIEKDEIESITNRIGDEFYEFIRALFDKKKEFNMVLHVEEIKDMWENYLHSHSKFSEGINHIIDDSSDVSLNRSNNTILIRLSNQVAKNNPIIEPIGLGTDFFKYVNNQIDAIQKTFVIVSLV